MNRVCIGVFILTGLLCSALSYAQSPGSRSASPDEQEEAVKYEQYYEIVLEQSLREYYNKGTFLVDVKATVNKVMVAKGYDVVEPSPALEFENLPGLPVIPQNLRSKRSEQDSLKVSGFDSRFKLNGLQVKVLVDTSYSREDIAFIEEAAAMISNTDLLRGDVVEVNEKVFPGINRKKKIEASSVLAKEKQANNLNTEAEVEPYLFLGVNWNDPKQLLYVISGLVALLLGLLLFMTFRKPKQEAQEFSQYPFSPQLISQSAREGNSKEAPANEVREISQDKQQQFEKDRMYITNASVSNPKMVTNLIAGWIESDEDEGIVRAVRSVYSVDHKLMDLFESHLNDDHYNSIQFGLSNIESIPINEKVEEVEKFKKSIQGVKKERKSEDSQSNLFDFLEQLTDQQLMHLVKGESDEMTAILLAQVAGKRSNMVLQKMKEQKRISTVLKMGKISNIPISIYKKVAAHFSSKALSVSDMKFVAADGIESILTTIDSMPVNEQEKFVRSIAEQDLALAKKIRKYFVAFDDLPSLEDEVLQASIENISTEDIIPALVGAPTNIQQKILGVRPTREQQLITSELQSASDFSTSDVEKARKVLLKEIRKLLKIERVSGCVYF